MNLGELVKPAECLCGLHALQKLGEQSVTGTYPPSSLLWIKTDIHTTPIHSYLNLASTFSHACCLLGAFLQCHEMSKPV